MAGDDDPLAEDAALDAALWVEEAHSHVDCAAEDAALEADRMVKMSSFRSRESQYFSNNVLV